MRSTKSPGLVGFVSLIVFVFLTVSATAQEQPDFPSEDNRNPYEVNQTLDSHGNIVRENHRDSLTVKPLVINRPKTAEATTTNKTKTQDEPLSFNFLYYIIQKFKGSDVVD
jgi:hypothetical protein